MKIKYSEHKVISDTLIEHARYYERIIKYNKTMGNNKLDLILKEIREIKTDLAIFKNKVNKRFDELESLPTIRKELRPK